MHIGVYRSFIPNALRDTNYRGDLCPCLELNELAQ